MTPATPVEVVGALLDGVPRLVLGDDAQVDRLAALYAESTLVTHPMSGAVPPLHSRDELRAHFSVARARVGAVDAFDVEGLVLHETTDPEVVVAEFRYAVRRGDETDAIPCVFVVRVRDGLIVESRDHARHAPAAVHRDGVDPEALDPPERVVPEQGPSDGTR